MEQPVVNSRPSEVRVVKKCTRLTEGPWCETISVRTDRPHKLQREFIDVEQSKEFSQVRGWPNRD